MTKSIEVSGKTRDEAISAGLAQLGMSRDDVSVEILEQERHGFLGIGSSPAKVRLTYEVPDAPPAPVSAPAPAEQKAESVKAPPVREEGKKPQEKKKPAPAQPSQPASAAAVPQAEGDLEQRVRKYLEDMLELMGVKAEITMTRRETGGLNVELSGNGMGAVIGRRGETLDAIQHLVNYSVNRGSEKRTHVSVDAENYRSKREDSLVHLAEKMAAKAVKYRRSMALEPMNSYERHVIHTALQNYEGVSTASVGVEPNRRVVVNYEKPESADRSSRPKSREWA